MFNAPPVLVGLKRGFHQIELSLASHSVTIFQTENRKKRYKALISEIYSPQEELYYALREIVLDI